MNLPTLVFYETFWEHLFIYRASFEQNELKFIPITHGFKSPHDLTGYDTCGVTLPVSIKVAIPTLSPARDASNHYTGN